MTQHPEAMVLATRKGARRARRITTSDLLLAERLRVRRVQIGLTQAKLGAYLGLTAQQIQKYERAMSRIPASRISALAEVLGVSWQFLLDAKPVVPERGAQTDTSRSACAWADEPDLCGLIAAYFRLRSRPQQNLLLQLAKDLVRAQDHQPTAESASAVRDASASPHRMAEFGHRDHRPRGEFP